MTFGSARVLDRLAAERSCDGAVFLTYSFDPGFFEDHVLRAVYRLSSDPVEQARRYYDEATAALQLAPTAVLVDAAQRRPGRRLPYEVLEVSSRVFHPKLALLLYEDFARLQVGSGNLSTGGYGGNTELFLHLDLAYNDAEACAMLREVGAVLRRLGQLARQTPRELIRVLDEVDRRAASIDPVEDRRFELLDSTAGPILDQALALIPEGAIVNRVGLLAPFFERDDDGALEDSGSLFGALAQACGPDIAVDIGVLWDNPPLVNATRESFAIDDHADRLWAWDAEYDDGDRMLEYITPHRLTAARLSYTDAAGVPRRFERDVIDEDLVDGYLWPVPPPIAFAPHQAIASAVSRLGSVNLWLHPSCQRIDGRPVHRPLHAKLLVFAFEHQGEPWTLVVVGSANASRKALLLATNQSGNVELCLAFCVRGSATLKDLVPELVWSAPGAFELKERSFPELPPNLALAIEEAIYDAASKELRIVWSEDFDLGQWELFYADQSIARDSALPTEAMTIAPFELTPTTAELTLRTARAEAAIPILVLDLVALPEAGPVELGLNELLLILGKRLGLERATTLRRKREGSAKASALETLFGEGVDPTRVFRAWWALADELADAQTSLRGMRLRLDGSLGARVIWQRLKDAAASRVLGADEVWFYGAELLMSLGAIAYDESATGAAKQSLLDSFREALQRDLEVSGPADPARPWLGKVRAFYEL